MFDYMNQTSKKELERYSRHIVLKEFNGENGIKILKGCCIAVVGIGGLGNAASSYIASMGFGSITLIDEDDIEISNLNRQIMFTVDDIGLSKAETMVNRLKKLNPNISFTAVRQSLTFENCLKILDGFNIVLDCTDNPHSRYCINDACVKLNIPVVFGSALKWEGQLSVFGYKGGPCLRCIFPELPHPDMIGTCDDQGIVGPVVGIIGSMQALEAAKIALNLTGVMSGRLFLFDGLNFSTKIVKIRSKSIDCRSCSQSLQLSELAFPPSSCIKQYSVLLPKNTSTVTDYLTILTSKTSHVLIDVRSHAQYNCMRFQHSIHIPLDVFTSMNLNQIILSLSKDHSDEAIKTVFIICRRGQKSRNAVNHLLNLIESAIDSNKIHSIYDIKGGFQLWSQKVDSDFPYF